MQTAYIHTVLKCGTMPTYPPYILAGCIVKHRMAWCVVNQFTFTFVISLKKTAWEEDWIFGLYEGYLKCP
jgi:hypothetical protein